MTDETKLISENQSQKLEEIEWNLVDDNGFTNILRKMQELYRTKNSDYGNSFDKTMRQFGLVSALTRLNDKLNRLNNLYTSQKQQLTTETIEDTLLDLANYCVLTLDYLKRNPKVR